MRDLSRKQFTATLRGRGFTPEMLGYWKLPLMDTHISVNELNGGPRLRDRLRWLLAELERRASWSKHQTA